MSDITNFSDQPITVSEELKASVAEMAATGNGPHIIKWRGGKIDTPGVYDMPIEDYHTDICVGPSVSSSGLRTIEQKSPAHYWHDSPLNPKRTIDDAQKQHFNVGSAAHTLLLGEHGFRTKYAVRPDRWKDWRTDASQAWRDDMVKSKRIVLTPTDVEKIERMAIALQADPLIQQGLFNGLAEKSLIWKDEETGVWLKSRPDTIHTDADVITDLKTIEEADHHSCQNAIWSHGYHMQLALGGMGMEQLFGRTIPNDGYFIVFVEKAEPNCVNIKQVSADAIMFGRLLIRRALRKFAECWEKGEWPGYADTGSGIDLPAWLSDRLQKQYELGQLSE